jgi:hypothetical protein
VRDWKLTGREKRILKIAGVLVLLSLVFFLVSGIKFLSYLSIESAGLCVLWILLGRWAEKSLVGKCCKVAFVAGVLAVLMVLIVME